MEEVEFALLDRLHYASSYGWIPQAPHDNRTISTKTNITKLDLLIFFHCKGELCYLYEREKL